MERMKYPKALGMASLIIFAALLFTTCKNPVSLFEEVKVEVMKANDRVLRVESVIIPTQEGTFNPTGIIEIRFDKEIELPEATSSMWQLVRIQKVGEDGQLEAPVEYEASGVSYSPALKVLRIRVNPLLSINTDYVLSFGELVSVSGKYSIIDKETINFRTSNVQIGLIDSLIGSTGSQTGYSNIRQANATISVNDVYVYTRFRFDLSGDGINWTEGSTSTWQNIETVNSGSKLVDLSSIDEDGLVHVRLSVWGNDLASETGMRIGVPDTATIFLDTVAPEIGSVTLDSGAEWATSASILVSFTESIHDSGSGIMDMSFSNNGNDWSVWEGYTDHKIWNLYDENAGGGPDDGLRTVHVRIRDRAGNMADASSSIKLDTIPPSAPIVEGTGLTNQTSHTWTWTSGGGGTGSFRYQFDATSDHGWRPVVATELISVGLEANREHILYVQERDEAGNWSNHGYFPVLIDTIAPPAPVVTGRGRADDPAGIQLTNSPRPIWTWSGTSADGTNYRYRFIDSSWVETDTSTFTSDSDLDERSHVLEVQQRDAAGNWSESGSWAIEVDLTPPAPPVVNGPTTTRKLRPTWTWASSGGIGLFRYSHVDGSAWISTESGSYTPSSDLESGDHVLYVQESDAAGNWSASGSKLITIDLESLPSPELAVPESITNNPRPVWAWVTGDDEGAGDDWYRYTLTKGATVLDQGEGASLSYTPDFDLGDGSEPDGALFVLSVEQRFPPGLWSLPGSQAILVDIVAPAAPVVSGPNPTNNLRPTWSWASGGNGSGIFRYQLNSSSGTWNTTGSTAYTPSADLAANTTHILYVQEQDAAGNWSASGSLEITVDTLAPNAPIVSSTTPTNNPRPTWTWSSGGGGGSGEYRYELNSTTGDWSATSTSSFSPAIDLAINTSHTLYVQERDAAGNWSSSGSWEVSIVPSTVAFDRQGGSGGSSSVTVTYGSPMPAATAPARTGYTFAGYWDAASGGTQYYTSTMASARNWDKAANTTLYAQWTGNTYTVTFDRQSGSGGSSSVTATYGSPMASATAPTRTGYTFTGYWDATSGGTQYYTYTMASARNWDKTTTATLYARWSVNSYTVTFDRQGGSGGSSSVSVFYGSPMPAATAPARSGYVFAGYYTSTGGGGTQYYTDTMASTRNWNLTANTILYAAWTTAVYVSTGGSTANSGLLPGQPKNSISDGIAVAQSKGISVVRIAAGTYNAASTITMVPGVSIQGGWNTVFSSRNWLSYKTVISTTLPLYPLFGVTNDSITGVVYEGLWIDMNVSSGSQHPLVFQIGNNASPVIQDNNIYIRSSVSNTTVICAFLITTPGAGANAIIRRNTIRLYRTNCTTTDSARGILLASGGSGSVYTIEKNRITLHSNKRADGIRTSSTSALINIKNNIISVFSSGSLTMGVTIDGGSPNLKVVNNTIYSYSTSSSEYGVYLNPAGGNSFIINNIFHSAGGGGYGMYKNSTFAGYDHRYNLTFGFSTHASNVSPISTTNTFTTSAAIFPSVFAAASIDSNLTDGDDTNYQINASDATYAYNKGMTTSSSTYGSVTDDILGLARPRGGVYDRGAYER